MAKLVLKDCEIVVDSVDLSTHVAEVTINQDKDEVDATGFQAGGAEILPGLRKDSFELTFMQDFDAASVDATLYPIFENDEEVEVSVKATDAATSATNPRYVGNCFLLNYAPLAGKVGDRSDTKVKFTVQGKITRDIT